MRAYVKIQFDFFQFEEEEFFCTAQVAGVEGFYRFQKEYLQIQNKLYSLSGTYNPVGK